MDRIALDHLTRVCGGADNPSEYARCVERVVAGEQARLPSTRPWWNPLATDTNSAPRATATLDRIRRECGKPPG
jgi:hypothetical protein